MKAAVAVLVMTAMSQAPGRAAGDLVRANRTLRPAEVAAVLAAARSAMAGKAVRLRTPADESRGSGGIEVVVGADGRPQLMRRNMSGEAGMIGGSVDGRSIETRYHFNAVVITEFTGRPARRCAGETVEGELIVDYRNEGGGWTTMARPAPDPGYPAGAFDILRGAAAAEAGGFLTIEDRRARAFVAPWTPPIVRIEPALVVGDPFPNVRREPPPLERAVQVLWIDVASLIPLRWDTPMYSYAFGYDSTLTIARPDGVTPPACVP